jgi:adenosine deaminase
MDFYQLPKVELHLHLDCSLSYSVVSRLNPAITHAEYLESFNSPAGAPSLGDILSYARREIELMQTEESLRLVTLDLFEQLQRDNIVYAEIRFAPLLHTEKGLSAEDVVSVVEAAVQTASQKNGIEARLLLCTLRSFCEAQSLETVKLVERFKGTSVVGFDIAGDEVGFPIDAHIAAFQYARAHNIPSTAHAGEARGAESVWETLQHFHPDRIGHGWRSIEDPALLEHLRQHQIHLEVCPTSNVHVYHQVCKTYSDHPVDNIYDAGISISVNSDTRTLVAATLTEEYEKMHHAFGWDKEHFLQCNLNALNAAFIPEPVKQQLIDRLSDAYRTL